MLQRLSLPSSFELGIVALIAVIICLVSIGFTIYESVHQARLVLGGKRIDATVAQVERIQMGRSSRLQITVRFATEAGAIINIKDIGGMGPGRREVGDIVPVVYLPSNPETVVVQGIKGFECLFLAFGIAFVSGLVFVKICF